MYGLKFFIWYFQDMENFLFLIFILLYLYNFTLYDDRIYIYEYFGLIFFIKFVLDSFNIL